MIIGINGKIGSGKDTVGKIIQYLTSKQATSKGSYSHCEEMGLVYIVDWEIKKFAGKLKEIASLLTGIPIEKFEDQEFKKTYLGKEWSRDVMPVSQEYVVNQDMTVRDFLQILGTEGLRDGLHTNVWVNALMCDYKKPCIASLNDSAIEKVIKENKLVYPNWIITDMRFPNELEAVKAKHGVTINVTRPGSYKVIVDGRPIHASETALDGHIFDYYIVNDGTIEELIKKVRQILKEEGII